MSSVLVMLEEVSLSQAIFITLTEFYESIKWKSVSFSVLSILILTNISVRKRKKPDLSFRTVIISGVSPYLLALFKAAPL